MECMDTDESDEILEPEDENQKVEKLKESFVLLKNKLSLSHELIKQYNDKIKECQQVTAELETNRNNLKELALEHNSCITKIVQLECENEDHRKRIENYTKIVPELKTKIAADKQHMQQLICKIQEFERNEIAAKSKKDDLWKEKLRALEIELRATKESHKLEIKQMEIKLVKSTKAAEAANNRNKKKETIITHEKGTCTGNKLEHPKQMTVEKCTMTNEFYSTKDDPYPLFCSKCLVKLDPAPLDQILKQMSSCPPMVTEVPSPRKEPDINKLRTPPRVSRHSFDSIERNTDVFKSDFQRLERKILSLERKLRKKEKKEVPHHQQGGNNPCCGFQYPNNCYLGPYPSLFQPGAMIRTQPDLFQFQNWQENFRSRKQIRKISMQKLNRRENKFRKKRKLDDGTSEWNIDSVPSTEFFNSNNADISADDARGPSPNLSQRSESPKFDFSKASECDKKNESRPLRGKKFLFSPERSCSPTSCNEEVHSDEEIVINDTKIAERSPEYETIVCERRKPGRPPKNTKKPSTKCSLVAQIRNLKKNCNNVKSEAIKIVAADDSAKKLTGNRSLEITGPVNGQKDIVDSIQQNKTEPILNGVDDYCAVKKQRIAHSARRPEINSLCERGKNFSELLDEASSLGDSLNDNAASNNQSETLAIIEKSDKLEDKVEAIEPQKKSKPLVRIERKGSSRDSADTDCSSLSKKSEIRYFEVETIAEGKMNEISNKKAPSLVEKMPNIKNSTLLQPCVVIPRIYLGMESIEEVSMTTPSTEEKEEEAATNLNSDIDKSSHTDASLRILRSKKKIVHQSSNKVLSKNESEDVGAKSSSLNHSEGLSRTMKVELIRCNGNPQNEDIHDTDKPEEVNEKILENDVIDPPITARTYKRRTRSKASVISPMRERRSRRIILNSSTNTEGENNSVEMGNENLLKIEQSDENIEKGLTPRAFIEQLLIKQTESVNRGSSGAKKINPELQQRRESQVLKELTILSEDPEWSSAVLLETISRLSRFKSHTIAKCSIDFLVTSVGNDEKLDRTHTPPAPLLTKTQQRILTMLVVLNRSMPNIIQLVQAGIEFRLFRLGHAPEVEVIEELTRVFTALARVQKDRERVRILCCDALYCLGLKAMCVIYVILISWPEVLPMSGSSSDPLILCSIDSIMTQTGDPNFPRFSALKKLLKRYYNYELSGYDSKALAKNLTISLREKRQNGLDTAIILLAKKKGPIWTYDHFIQGGLLQMIIHNAHPSIYDAFCLLGHLMRSFPIDDPNGLVKNILEQLCALMESGAGSMQQQEGVATALLSLHRHNQNVVTKAIIDWEPSEPLSESTSRQLMGLFDSRPPLWWRKYIGRIKCTK